MVQTQLWTAQYAYPGPSRMDITHATKDRLGKFFAPTKKIVYKYKYTNNDEKVAREIYKQEYSNLILSRQPKMTTLGIWEEIMTKPYIVLVCYCNPKSFCHRHLVKDMLVKRGAKYIGEFTDFGHFKKPANEITSFKNEYNWLSNFHTSPFTFQNISYPSNEHFFQAWKGTPAERVHIANLPTAGKAKQAGRKVRLQPNWDNIKEEIMLIGLNLKFSNPELKTKLIATGTKMLIEGNTWHDNYWGNCTCNKCLKTPGQNKLGKMLMSLRTQLQGEQICHIVKP